MNKEELKEYHKNYRKNNPDKIKKYNEKSAEKILCDCGSRLRRDGYHQHLKSTRHCIYVKSLVKDLCTVHTSCYSSNVFDKVI